MSQTERLYLIDSQIRLHRYPNADSVCRRFEVSRRTAYSDRDTLIERLHAPLVYDRQHRGWRYSDCTYVLPYLAFSQKEASTLSRALLTAREYLGAADAEPLAYVAGRLAEYIPPLSAAWQSAGGSMHATPDVSVSAELLNACETAIAGWQRLEVLYFSAHRDSTDERVIHPYHLHNYQGEWHLIGWCEWRQDIRQFFLGRIREWRLLAGEGAYQIDPTFDVSRYLAQGFGTMHGENAVNVRLLFSATQSRWARERIYHPTQTVRELDDGRIELSLTVAGTAEILRWVLGYGSDVEVLAPDSLRCEVAEAAKKVTEIYRRVMSEDILHSLPLK